MLPHSTQSSRSERVFRIWSEELMNRSSGDKKRGEHADVSRERVQEYIKQRNECRRKYINIRAHHACSGGITYRECDGASAGGFGMKLDGTWQTVLVEKESSRRSSSTHTEDTHILNAIKGSLRTKFLRMNEQMTTNNSSRVCAFSFYPTSLSAPRDVNQKPKRKKYKS